MVPGPIVSGWLRQLAARSHDLLFPAACAGCDRPGYAFCPWCAQSVERPAVQRCGLCNDPLALPGHPCADCHGARRIPVLLARAAAVHAGPLRTAIHRFKYEGQPELAQFLARYLVAAYAGSEWQQLRRTSPLVVPVPLHPKRRAERGYNQADLLAQAFCRKTGFTVEPDWLRRARLTRPQVGLDAAARTQNVQGAFRADAGLAGRNVLLIDDVFTTGSTLIACAEAAIAAGARIVCAMTLAMPTM